MPLTHQAVHAFKWSILGEIGSRTIGPLTFLVLARLLVPEDFGVVAAATVIISLSQVFSDAGLSKALVQRQDKRDESANIVFWFNLAIGLVIVAVLLIGAPLIAAFFHDPRIAPVVRVLSLQVLLAAFSSVHTALLQKDLNFKELFWVRIITSVAPAVASIPLAVSGLGYWALVAGTLVGQFAQSAVLWARSGWRPTLAVDRSLAFDLLDFGKWAMFSGLLIWFYGWMDAIVVGHFLGARDMGLYRTGNTFVTMIFGLAFPPLLPVLYSLLSRAQHDLPRLRSALATVVHAMTLVALPVGCYLFVVDQQLADVVFGASWQGVAPVIGVMALVHAFSWIVGANGEVYRAIGKPHVETWVNAGLLAVYLAGYLLGVKQGLETFLWVRLGLALLAALAHIVVATRVIGLPPEKWLHGRILVTAVISAAIVFPIGQAVHSPSIALLTMSSVFAMIVLCGIAVLERAFLERLTSIFRPRAA